MVEPALEQAFLSQRPRLFQLAYRLMGTVADAEDALQDVYLGLRRTEPEDVAAPGGYLTRAVVRRCLDQWKSARRKREQYVGSWLPEPLPATADDPSRREELAESVSLAFLVVLETLAPVERAVFLLHDVFQYPFDEVATIVDKSSPACRQIAHRARLKVAERRPRFPASPEEHRRLVGRFLEACRDGDLAALQDLLAADVMLYSDGGGLTPAARVPIIGIQRVVRLLLGVRGKSIRTGEFATLEMAEVNAAAAVVMRVDGTPRAVFSFEIDGGRIRRVYTVLNPEKLASISAIHREGGDP
jgi:RNA polymerase sigma-70 factor (ECF subfamily)